MGIKITVLMSVYNTRGEYLRNAIKSILTQTFKDFEFIIINDASDENTTSVLDEYTDIRIVRIDNERNLGLTASLNKGLKKARGKYIARMDSDDISMPDRLRLQYRYMERHPGIAVLGSWARLDGKIMKYQGHASSSWRKVRMLIENVGIAHPTAFIRTDFLRQYNLVYDESIMKSQDYDLWTRCLAYGRIAVCPHVLLEYRVHDGQISAQNADDQIAAIRQIRTRLFRNLIVDHTLEELEQFLTLENITMDPYGLSEFFDKIIGANERKRYYDKRILQRELTFVWFKIILGVYESKNPGQYCKTRWFYKVLNPLFWFYLVRNAIVRNI